MSLLHIRNSKTAVAMIAAGAFAVFATTAAHAEFIEMTLHGFCGASAGASTCTDNKVITPTSQNPLLEFGFTRSPDSNQNLKTPTFELVLLVPDAAPGADSQTPTYTGTGTGVTAPTTLKLVGDFTRGTLDTFLGVTRVSPGGPANPFSGFEAGETSQHLSATGFDVYQANFGSVKFGSPDPTFVPSGSFDGALIQGTEIYALVEGSAPKTRQDGTALSSTIIETGKPPLKELPEPGPLALLGIGFLGIAVTRSGAKASHDFRLRALSSSNNDRGAAMGRDSAVRYAWFLRDQSRFAHPLDRGVAVDHYVTLRHWLKAHPRRKENLLSTSAGESNLWSAICGRLNHALS